MLLLVYIFASFNGTSVIMRWLWSNTDKGAPQALGPQRYVTLSHCVHYLICGFEFYCISVFQMTFSCHGIILTESTKCHCETVVFSEMFIVPWKSYIVAPLIYTAINTKNKGFMCGTHCIYTQTQCPGNKHNK